MKFLQKGNDRIQLPKDTFMVENVYEILPKNNKQAMLRVPLGNIKQVQDSSRSIDHVYAFSDATARIIFPKEAENRRRFQIFITIRGVL